MQLDVFITTILAGIFATYVLLALALWAPGINLPRLDFSRAMTNLSFGESFEDNPPYFAGMAVIYMNGMFFALLYTGAVGQYLPGDPLIKGTIWGVALFAISGLFFVPVFLKEGFFLSHIHRNAWITSLIAHGAWGLMVGWLAPIVQ